MILLILAGAFYLIAQLYSLMRLRGKALLYSRLCALFMLFMWLISLVLLAIGNSAWPTALLLTSPLALVIQLALLFSNYSEGR